ncbi:hypothetical protein SDC9_133582 [bioreactor metagenome]|uniref:Uncharacterized protein n=1 Tax=bioreactor metagenome TaxID=1076179 RepID=A0A645DC35_9ZZZZ
MINREGFVAGLEVEHLAVTALEGEPAAEYFTAFKPGEENNFGFRRHIEPLAVHLLVRKLEIFADALRDRMRGGNIPKSFFFGDFAPFERAAATGDRLEDFGKMTGMEHDQAHAFLNALQYFGDDFIADFAMGTMPPPDQHVGGLDDLVAQAVIGLVKGRGADLEVGGGNAGFDCAVDAFGVELPDGRDFLFVTEFVPDCDSDFFHESLLFSDLSSIDALLYPL